MSVPKAVADMRLADQSGHRVSLSDFSGKTVVVSPFLTLCQEICPFTTANFRRADAAVVAAGLGTSVEFVEVTVDPWRDNVSHLKAYQGLYGAEPNWEFLTGSPQQVAEFWKGFHLAFSKTPNAAGDTPHDWLTGAPMTYDVNHQNVLYILGTGGQVKWLVDGTPWANHAPLPTKLLPFLSSDGKHNYAVKADQSWTADDLLSALSYETQHRIQ